jgi:hypothetical protein
MIQSGRATLAVTSIETEPELVSEILGLTPTAVERAGTTRRSGRTRSHHLWVIDGGRVENSETDQTGTGPLAQLISHVSTAAGKVQSLPRDCNVRIWWSAYSDSTQGVFVVPAELSRAIGELGIDLYATVYLGDEVEA